ncbi:hypothetical protein VTJ04DRAFT_6205 [Mycothermus thermophilus]|uniref:uncharacterized protein n=1 Tax=Humicola insolens TaxID=85995 RepID=UPI003741EB94
MLSLVRNLGCDNPFGREVSRDGQQTQKNGTSNGTVWTCPCFKAPVHGPFPLFPRVRNRYGIHRIHTTAQIPHPSGTTMSRQPHGPRTCI